MSQSRRGDQEHRRSSAWPYWWSDLCALVTLAVVVAVCLGGVWTPGMYIEPLLVVPPALAGINATAVGRPLIYGAAGVLVAAAMAVEGPRPPMPIATMVSVVVVTVVSVLGVVRSARRNQRLADVISVAEIAQRTVLRPLPGRMGPLDLGVVYLAAAAEARVGGDLYEVADTPYGIRLIMGDVRGKGLDAVEIAADVLGTFRVAAHDAPTLAVLARRLEAGLTRRSELHEEFVTAVLAEIDPVAGSLTVHSCGHPPPVLISSRGSGDSSAPDITFVNVPAPAPPLGLLGLGDGEGASRTVPFTPGHELLLYTDGVTEARDRRRRFYPLNERLADLAGTGRDDGIDLLDRLRVDLERHVGGPLGDDAALLHVRARDAPAEDYAPVPTEVAGRSVPV